MGSMVLYIGGARSGKSRLAQACVQGADRVAYIATATACDHTGQPDSEMQARIQRHRSERPAEWLTIEEPRNLERAFGRAREYGAHGVLLDCLTLWLTHRVLELWPEHWNDAAESGLSRELEEVLVAAKPDFERVVLVTNELGGGLVPTHPLGRVFRDAQGRLNQRVASVVDEVQFVVAGLSMKVK